MKRKKLTHPEPAPPWVQEFYNDMLENKSLELIKISPQPYHDEYLMKPSDTTHSSTDPWIPVKGPEGARHINRKALIMRRKAKKLARKSRQRNR